MKSVIQYAGEKGITRQAVWQKIKSGKVKAFRIGRAYIIKED